MSQHDTLTLREALRSIQYEAASLADAQVIALQALNATYPARAALSATQPAQAAQSTHWTENEPVRLAPSRVGRVYVAGPMTGIEEFNFPAFNAEADKLRGEGLAVLNPAEHGIVDGAEWADYLRHDIAGLTSCERIHLLRGWEKSKGAQLEVTIAQALGMRITYQDGAEPAQAAQGEPAEHWHRLYLEKCQQYNDRVAQLGGVIEGLEAEAAQGEPVRELKSALNGMLTFFGMDDDADSKPVFDKARKALTLTDEQVTAAARCLCKRYSETCEINEHDAWTFYSDDFKDEAREILQAANRIGLEVKP